MGGLALMAEVMLFCGLLAWSPLMSCMYRARGEPSGPITLRREAASRWAAAVLPTTLSPSHRRYALRAAKSCFWTGRDADSA